MALIWLTLKSTDTGCNRLFFDDICALLFSTINQNLTNFTYQKRKSNDNQMSDFEELIVINLRLTHFVRQINSVSKERRAEHFLKESFPLLFDPLLQIWSQGNRKLVACSFISLDQMFRVVGTGGAAPPPPP